MNTGVQTDESAFPLFTLPENSFPRSTLRRRQLAAGFSFSAAGETP